MRRQYVLAELLTKDHQFIRQVLPQKTTGTLRWNAASTAYLTLRDSHPAIPLLTAEDGPRARVWQIVIDGASLIKRKLVEGPVGTIKGDDAPNGTVTIPVTGDWITGIIGWQAPASPIGGQGAAEYDRYTGRSDDNALAAIAANAARLGLPWDVAASPHLGTVGPLELRMHALEDKILPPLIADRLQLVVDRTDAGRWDVRVTQGEVYPRPITPQSGVLASWSWVQEPPTATRVVVGGRGEGVEREFVLVVDAALEAQLGRVIEVFVDARSAEVSEDITPYGWAELAKRSGRSGVTAQLRETSWFQFGDAYTLGTRLNLQPGTLSVEDVVTEIEITHDTRGGFTAVPTVGLATGDPQKRLVEYVKSVATAVRALERN